MINLAKCWTGRSWINLFSGWFAVGFGPNQFIERIYWRKKLVWYSKSKKGAA
jgi:hypothetical protein